jgi:hypothetical protein
MARDSFCETEHHQHRSALDRASAAVHELAIPHHLRLYWTLGSVWVAGRSARKQVVAHYTRRYCVRARVRSVPRLPFVLTMSGIAWYHQPVGNQKFPALEGPWSASQHCWPTTAAQKAWAAKRHAACASRTFSWIRTIVQSESHLPALRRGICQGCTSQ